MEGFGRVGSGVIAGVGVENATAGVAGICVAVSVAGKVIVIVVVSEGAKVAIEVAVTGISIIPSSLPHRS